MEWGDLEQQLDKLKTDLNMSWEHLRAIAKDETFSDSISTEKKMKSAQFLTQAAERLKVLPPSHPEKSAEPVQHVPQCQPKPD